MNGQTVPLTDTFLPLVVNGCKYETPFAELMTKTLFDVTFSNRLVNGGLICSFTNMSPLLNESIVLIGRKKEISDKYGFQRAALIQRPKSIERN